MMKYAVLVLVVTLFGADAHAHSLFNSAEKFYGGYRVQVATTPEFPPIGEPSNILIRVTDRDFVEVDEFTMGIRFFYDDQQISAIPPTYNEGAHWDISYTWEQEGNHIVIVDLYEMSDDGQTLTYTFNMGTQSPFGYIFIFAITTGALTFTGIMIYIYAPKIMKRQRSVS